MSTAVVEIHDAGLSLVSDEPGWEPGPASPGYALVDGDRILVGSEAVERARLQPRRVHHRFWHDLGTAALPRPFPSGLTFADLAHAHLEELWKRAGIEAESVVLVLPGSFSRTQLGLTLGIARACGLPVEGLVDTAVAAAVGVPAEGKVLHLDLHLHQAVLTELAVDREIQRRRLEIEERAGLIAFRDSCARRIARLFVQASRFDPLHSAASEQQLYLALDGWLRRLEDAETVEITLTAGDRELGLELPRGEALLAAEPFHDRLVDLLRGTRRAGEAITVLLSHRAATLPGLAARLGELRDTRVTVLPPRAAGHGALLAREAIRAPGDELPFQITLPAGGGFGADGHPCGELRPSALPVPSAPAPTHLLLDARAFPLTEEPLVLGTAPPGGGRSLRLSADDGADLAVPSTQGISRLHCSLTRRGGRVVLEDHSTYGTFLNGERVHRRVTVAAGDRVRLGSPGVELRLIRVLGEEGVGEEQGSSDATP